MEELATLGFMFFFTNYSWRSHFMDEGLMIRSFVKLDGCVANMRKIMVKENPQSKCTSRYYSTI